MAVLPSLLAGLSVGAVTNPEDALLGAYFTVEMAPVFGVMTALVLSFLLGVALTFLDGNVIHRSMVEFRDIVNMVIRATLIPLLPLYIFGMMIASMIRTMIVRNWTKDSCSDPRGTRVSPMPSRPRA